MKLEVWVQTRSSSSRVTDIIEIDDEDILEHDLVVVQDLVDLVDRARYRGRKK